MSQTNEIVRPINHLHVHSEYSILDGANRLEAIVKAAVDQGSNAIALTDHGNMFGTFEFYRIAKKSGIKPIIGVEAYMAPQSRFLKSGSNDANHVTLLVQNSEGYRNLIKLVSLANTEGYYYKPRMDMELLAKYNAGLICLSGCLSGMVQEPLQRGDYEAAKAAAQAYKDIFGDRFYLEMMRHNLDDQNRIEQNMFKLRDELGVPFVATNDSHYTNHEDHEPHAVLCCLQGGGKTMDDPKRFKLPNDQFYLKSAKEMRDTFADIPEACDATLEIADRIDSHIDGLEDSPPGVYHIPAYPIPEDKKIDKQGEVTQERYLRKLCLGGLRKRYGNERTENDPVLRERVEYELGVINKMGFASYFLIVWDFIKYARDNDIPVGPGRGSAVGSVVSYCLGITDLEPIEFGLIFERFLNPDRISMPDIDTDFCVEGRDQIIRYVRDKYGDDRVAQIVTFGTMASKGAIKGAGRALFGDVMLPVINKITKIIGGGAKPPSVKEARKIPEIAAMERQDQQVKRLMDTAEKLEGYVQNIGTHAAAVVISDAPLTDYLPLTIITKKVAKDSEEDTERTVNTQFEMVPVEILGLLKMDFLGLKNLSIMKKAETEIRRTKDKNFVLREIPRNDKKTYAMIARGETSGVFQLESDGMKRMLIEMKPDKLEDIVAAVSLYRPGPMDFIPQYNARKNGKEKAQYLHPKLEPILKDTYGIAIYQEQIMSIAREIAGFTMGQADNLRKIMGKKQEEKIDQEGIKFVESAIKEGVDKDIAESIFHFMRPFARYGFNKSHAVAYGWIAYQTAYLKANYPVEYLAALMTYASAKTSDTNKLVEYLEEAKKMGVNVLPPDVNESMVDFTVVGKQIRFGFKAIKKVSSSAVLGLIEERNKKPFTTIFDLVARTQPLGLQKMTIEGLIKVGACDRLEGHRAQQLEALEHAFNIAKLDADEKNLGQINLFGEIEVREELSLPNVPPVRKMELLKWEHEGLGIYVSGHPADAARELLNKRKASTIIEAKKRESQRLLVGGMITNIKRMLTKATNQLMLVATLEDHSGSIEVILFPKSYEAHNACFVENSIIAIAGRIQDKNSYKDNKKDPKKYMKDNDTENLNIEEDQDDEEEIMLQIVVDGVEEIAPANWEPRAVAEGSHAY